MDVAQQFCLKWNNYQSTLHQVFHKLWLNGTFVDVSLVVEGRRIDCHKVILSACSTYFEQLLSEHSSHPHPLILLHDIPYAAVEALVTFMYMGEINVSQDQLTAVLKAADSLKIKGLADSSAISNFTKFRLLTPDITKVTSSQYRYCYPTSTASTPQPPPPSSSALSYVSAQNGNSAARCYSMPLMGKSQYTGSTPLSACSRRSDQVTSTNSSIPPRKRPRLEEAPASLPPSPPISLEEPQTTEQIRSPPQELRQSLEIKAETESEATDTELQIDETAGQSPESAESDSVSSRNTPVLDADIQEQNERIETAQSLAALATSGSLNLLSSYQAQQQQQQPQQLLAPKPRRGKEDKAGANGSSKNGERSYTFQDLEDGIEAVLMGQLTPAKAIAKYNVPRRTFFRRLSAVRKIRGIPSSKENASEHYLNGGKRSPTTPTPDPKTPQVPIVIPGIVSNDGSFLQNLGKGPKVGVDDPKKDKKNCGLNLTSGGMFSLLNVSANPNYEYYYKYLKLQTQGKDVPIVAENKREPSVDGNRNLSSTDVSEQALALVTQNGSLK